MLQKGLNVINSVKLDSVYTVPNHNHCLMVRYIKTNRPNSNLITFISVALLFMFVSKQFCSKKSDCHFLLIIKLSSTSVMLNDDNNKIRLDRSRLSFTRQATGTFPFIN